MAATARQPYICGFITDEGWSMKLRIKQLLLAGMLAPATLPPSPAWATGVMDIDAENLVRGAGFMKPTPASDRLRRAHAACARRSSREKLS